MNNTYRSIFSGQQIDDAVSGMQNVLTKVSIVNDFSGGTDKAASAQLAVTLNNSIINLTSPASIQTALLSINGNQMFTTAEQTKLNNLSTSFVGSYINPTTRTANLNPVNFVGTELSGLIDDGTNRGMSQISRWDYPSASWKQLRLYNVDEFIPLSVPTASAVPIYSFDITRFSFIKMLVCCADTAGLNRQIQECLVSFVGTNTYISVYGEVGNNSNLFNLTTSLSGNILTVTATTSVPATILSYKMTDMM